MIEFGKSKTFLDSLRYAGRGLRLGWQREKNIRVQVTLFVLAVGAGWYFNLTRMEWLSLLEVSGLVVGLEFMNSALEYIEDVLHPTFHEAIGHSKDMAAAAVLVASIIALIVAIVVFSPHVWRLVA